MAIASFWSAFFIWSALPEKILSPRALPEAPHRGTWCIERFMGSSASGIQGTMQGLELYRGSTSWWIVGNEGIQSLHSPYIIFPCSLLTPSKFKGGCR